VVVVVETCQCVSSFDHGGALVARFPGDFTIESIADAYAYNPFTYTGYMWSYTYDAANQMTRERQRQYTSGSVVGTTFDQQYSFDAAGNRLTRTGSGTGYEAFDATGGSGYNDLNQLVDYTIDGGDPIYHTYDNGGRLTDKYDGSRIDWDYYWNADGTMARVQNNDDGTYIKYTYDWEGRRLEREDETASSNGPKRRYYFAGATPVAERTATYISSYTWSNDVYHTLDSGKVVWQRVDGSTDKSMHSDHTASILAEASNSGIVTVTHEHDVKGRPILSSAGGWSDNSMHFRGMIYDGSTDLSLNGSMWIDTSTAMSIHVSSRAPDIGSGGSGGHDGGEPPPNRPVDSCAEFRRSDKFPTRVQLDAIMRDVRAIPDNVRLCMTTKLNDYMTPGNNMLQCRPNSDPICRGEAEADHPTRPNLPRKILAVGHPGTPSPGLYGKTMTICTDNIGNCSSEGMAENMVHEAAHNCGLPNERLWGPTTPELADDFYNPTTGQGIPWHKSNIPGTTTGGGVPCR